MAEIDSVANGLYAAIYTDPQRAVDGLSALRDSVASDSDRYYALTPHLALAHLINGQAATTDSLLDATRSFVARNTRAALSRERLTSITAVIHSLYGRNAEAADDFRLASQLARENGNWLLAVKNIANTGEMLELAGDPARAVVMLRSAIVLADSTGCHDMDFSIITRAAGIYNVLGNYDEADRFYNRNLARVDSIGSVDRFYFYSSRGNSYYYRENYARALDDFRSAEALLPSIADPYLDAVTHSNLGECLMYLDSLDAARRYITAAVKEFDDLAVNDVNQLFYLNSLRGDLELRSGNTVLARRLLLATDPDSVTLTPRYVALHHHRLQNLYAAEGNYPKALEHMNKAEALDDSVLHFIARNYSAEVMNRHTQDTTILHTRLRMAEKEEEISRLYLWIAVAVALAVLITVGYWAHWLVRRRRNLRQLEKLRTTMLHMRLENARNRISPHFVFNILNSELPADNVNIRNLVSLMRMNLELCNRHAITLGEELDFIRAYLDVVSPSLGRRFRYEETIDPAINPESIRIPAMMLQIVVENAVKHGLTGYDYPGKFIIITLMPVDGGYRLEVVNSLPDDGSEPHTGTGTGLAIVEQTIAALNRHNTRPLTLTTRVTVTPVRAFHVEIFVPASYNFHLDDER